LGQALIRANGVTDSQNIAVVRSKMSPAACRRGEKARVKKGDLNALAAESWRIAGEFGVTATCPSAAAVTFSTGSDSRA
jgi:hypothetical protein